MEESNVFITINHTEKFGGTGNLRVGDRIILRKDHDNAVDDEAITAFSRHDVKCGYVANSVCSVARGTYSAGRVYDKIDEEAECEVMFILDERIIAMIKTTLN